jgi:hypothetical protein
MKKISGEIGKNEASRDKNRCDIFEGQDRQKVFYHSLPSLNDHSKSEKTNCLALRQMEVSTTESKARTRIDFLVIINDTAPDIVRPGPGDEAGRTLLRIKVLLVGLSRRVWTI